MPLYEYLCESCGRRSEVLQRLDEPPLAICPHCGGALRKLLSAPSFQFKGSGWYQTDYARKPAADGGSSKVDGGEGSAPAESSSSGGDAKPAASEAASKPAPKAPSE